MAAVAGRHLQWRRAAAILLGAVVALALTTVPAVAHNSLLSTNPSDRQRVSRVPAEIVLTFDEAVVAIGSRVVITGPSGPVQQGQPRSVDTTVTQALQAGAPAGTYTVDWRIASADGHPISGTFSFTADAGGGPPTATEPVPSPASPEETGSATAPWLVAFLLTATTAGVLLALLRRRSKPGRTG